MTRPPNDRGQGRKALPPEERAEVRVIRLKDAHWAEFLARGGVEWLRKVLSRRRR